LFAKVLRKYLMMGAKKKRAIDSAFSFSHLALPHIDTQGNLTKMAALKAVKLPFES
jgi:hypothetical protein